MPSSGPDAESRRVLQSWIDTQFEYWDAHRPTLENIAEVFGRLNETRDDVFIFAIAGQSVEILPKSRHYSAEQLANGSNEHTKRALAYRNFLASVVRESPLDLDCRLAMSMHDMALESSVAPFFAFQMRKAHSHALLLPDIDAVLNDFYPNLKDPTSYEHKMNKAVFVGSTTGSVHSLASVRALSNERLRLGVAFRDDSDVVFRLPNIVQCDSAETAQAIRDMGFGSGQMNWDQQLKYRFLISTDGNGATCSRVAIALKSNSVLVKFESDNVLWYFAGLKDGENFVSVREPEDVRRIIEQEHQAPGTLSGIARAASAFFEAYLTRAAAMAYTAQLLRRYAALLGIPSTSQTQSVSAPSEPRSDVRATCIAHFRDQGDARFDVGTWIGDLGASRVLEGFQLHFESGIRPGYLECEAVTEKQPTWVDALDTSFVGSRSQSNPITGLAFRLKGEAADRYDCVYRCAFLDGSLSPDYANGERCVSVAHLPIKAFQISFPFKRSRAA